MEFEKIEYDVSYRNIKYPRLEFKTGKLLLVLPFKQNPCPILQKHKGWIIKKNKFIEECLKNSSDKEIVKRTDEKFVKLIYSLVKKNAKGLGVKTNKIYFKNMRTKWASCSITKGNITMNVLMKYLPEYLIKYIVFHELVHLIEKRHNTKFWNIISKRFKNYKELEKELFSWWFLFHNKFRLE